MRTGGALSRQVKQAFLLRVDFQRSLQLTCVLAQVHLGINNDYTLAKYLAEDLFTFVL